MLLYKNNSFNIGNFKNERFTVKIYGDFEKIDLEGWVGMPCRGGGTLRICEDAYGIGQTFKYNPTNKRFISTYTSSLGYLDYPSSEGYDTDSLRAGKCEKF